MQKYDMSDDKDLRAGEFVSGEEMGLAGEIHEQLKSAPWYVVSAFLHLVVLVLLMLIPTAQKRIKGNVVIIRTDFAEEIRKNDDSEKVIEPDPNDRFLDDVVQAADNSSMTSDITPAIKPNVDFNVNVVEFDEPIDIGEQNDELADAGDDLKPALLTVSGSNGHFSSMNRINISDVSKKFKLMIPQKSSSGRGVMLVWLLDQSPSMKDDQEKLAAQARDIQDLLTDGGRKRMMSCVVTFGKEWTMIQRPTTSASKISEAIRNVAIDKSGIENTNQAIVYCCDSILTKYSDWTKVIVLLSDESASDHSKFYKETALFKAGSVQKRLRVKPLNITGHDLKLPLVEVALRRLVRNRARLFVIGKESPFQSDYVRENFVDSNGKMWKWVRADRGPETPRIEVPLAYSQNTSPWSRGEFRGDLKAGYGVYDLSYLAKGSKGAYFILEDETTTVRRAMTFSERMQKPFTIDWKVMASYSPDVVSRVKYDRIMKAKRGRWGNALYVLNKFYNEKGNKITRYMVASPPSRYYERLKCLQARKRVIGRILDYIKDKRATDKELYESKNKRQIANIDLYFCVAIADQIITESWCDAWENYRGSTENVKNEDPEYYTALFTRAKKGSSLSPAERKKYDKRMKKLLDACNDVIRRHPNTPYAIAARWLPKGSRRWGVKAYLNRERHKRSIPLPSQ
jgi:hypothetical protein